MIRSTINITKWKYAYLIFWSKRRAIVFCFESRSVPGRRVAFSRFGLWPSFCEWRRGVYLAWSFLRVLSLQIIRSSHYGYNLVLQLVRPIHILYSIRNFVGPVFPIVGQVMDVIWRVHGCTRFTFGRGDYLSHRPWWYGCVMRVGLIIVEAQGCPSVELSFTLIAHSMKFPIL